ncbi:MAG: CopG family transcriptional regulator [Stigonema ocellatum SAG 48.90 = DSM 106950]|nr:CopG family transcriptional regulator [Stigonema ocellatum SAG 48.90 = DSM 106950]
MNKKWAIKRITLNLAAIEAEKLQLYCNQTGRPATDVIRELIRGLSICDEVAQSMPLRPPL